MAVDLLTETPSLDVEFPYIDIRYLTRKCSTSFRAGWGLVLFLCLTVSNPVPAWGQSSPPAREYEIKAAFMYHFARFVEWPAEEAWTQVTLCVLESPPMERALKALERKTVKDKPLTVRRLQHGEEGRDCQIVFIGALEPDRQGQVLETFAGAQVLTVGDAKTFARAGGIIRLFNAGNRIRFEINLEAARRAGLEISSRMLKLAEIV